ncbi:DNA circularization protein [Mannheimia massilioguelmaensis]|uniref:DNA circularization protein n=1 Tax=Mannheimia massilioguelmaensis TaxID=1604354 RepID=UPI0005C9F529|nr:DNA circularization N-terminal domain-containing protein [Mannheimia massilioguelmaensis]
MSSIKTGKGSFRGVPFLIEEQQGQDGGRRIVTHEYPLRDDGLTEDLGARLRNYHVSCLVIGDDYLSQAEKLIDALEAKGEGTLKHPFFGNKEVRVSEYKANYSTSHLRVVRFEITFVPAVGQIAPLASQDTRLSALSQYSNALNALSDEFASAFEQAMAFMDEIMDSPYLAVLDQTLDFVDSVFDGIGSVLNAGTDLKNRLTQFKSRLESLLHMPKTLAAELQSLTKLTVLGSFDVAAVAAGGRSTTKNYGGLTISDNTNSTTTSQSAVDFQRVFSQAETMKTSVNNQLAKLNQQSAEISNDTLAEVSAAQQNKQATTVILNRLFAAQMAETNNKQTISDLFVAKTQYLVMRLVLTTIALEYSNVVVNAVTVSAAQAVTERNAEGISAMLIESQQDVRRYSETIDAQLDNLALTYADLGYWQSYESLETYRLTVLNDLRTRGEQLANSKSVTLCMTQPALVVEFEQTGNAKTWERFAVRNNLAHPLFCTGNQTVEVLQ